MSRFGTVTISVEITDEGNIGGYSVTPGNLNGIETIKIVAIALNALIGQISTAPPVPVQTPAPEKIVRLDKKAVKNNGHKEPDLRLNK